MESQPAFPLRVELRSAECNVVAMERSAVRRDPVDEQAPLLCKELGSPPVLSSNR